MSTIMPQRCPCGCGKFDHNAFVPQLPRTFDAPYPAPDAAPPVSARLGLWEKGWSVEKIAEAWNTERRPLTADQVQAVLDEASLEPCPGPSPEAVFPHRIDKAVEVTIGQFRQLAKARSWSEGYLVKRCRGQMDHPTETVREILAGKGLTKPRFTGESTKPKLVNLEDTVLVWAPPLHPLPRPVRRVRRKARTGGGYLLLPGMSEAGISEEPARNLFGRIIRAAPVVPRCTNWALPRVIGRGDA
jgi:hypothetical protein